MFSEPWSCFRLSEVVKNEKRAFAGGPFGSNLKSSDYREKGIPIIQLGNITDSYLDFSSNLKFASEKKADELISNNAFPNELIVAKMMPAGKACISTFLYDRYLLGSDAIRICVDQARFNIHFLCSQLNAKRVHKWITNRTGGSTRARIGIPILKEAPIYAPTVKEQNKIGTFIDLLQQRIDTQNKIIEDIVVYRNSIRERIFKNGSINTKLGMFLEEYTERNKHSYEPVAVGKNGIRKRSEVFSRELSQDYSKNKVIRKNTLIIGMGTKQIDIAVDYFDEPYCVSPAYSTFKIKNIDSFYLDEYLKSINNLLSLRYMITGARQGKSVNKAELLEHPLLIHHNQTIVAISKLFNCLNDKIIFEKRIRDKYIEQKVFLLNQLFI